jgi:hypothetical protein
MNVIRVTKLNDDGSVAFDGLLGPNEVRYLLENGLNCIMQAGAEAIEGILGDVDEEEEEEPIFVKGNDTVQ